MTETKQAILAAALLLSDDDRQELADRIFESVGHPGPGGAEFTTELQRRVSEVLSDPDASVTWEETKQAWDRDGVP